MNMLLPRDYEFLSGKSVTFIEDPAQRYLVLRNLPLTPGLYQQDAVDLLLKVPPTYPDSGFDMFWTYPRLVLKSGQVIRASNNHGDGDNVQWDGREYCRWSRHWQQPHYPWRPGIDFFHAVYTRVFWCLENPNHPKLD